MPSLPESKDLDELEFKSSKKEKDNELVVKLLKLREHLCSIHEAYNKQLKVALDCMRNHLETSLMNVTNCCCLLGKKVLSAMQTHQLKQTKIMKKS